MWDEAKRKSDATEKEFMSATMAREAMQNASAKWPKGNSDWPDKEKQYVNEIMENIGMCRQAAQSLEEEMPGGMMSSTAFEGLVGSVITEALVRKKRKAKQGRLGRRRKVSSEDNGKHW